MLYCCAFDKNFDSTWNLLRSGPSLQRGLILPLTAQGLRETSRDTACHGRERGAYSKRRGGRGGHAFPTSTGKPTRGGKCWRVAEASMASVCVLWFPPGATCRCLAGCVRPYGRTSVRLILVRLWRPQQDRRGTNRAVSTRMLLTLTVLSQRD